MKILITGTTGMLGLAVRENFKEAFPGAAIYIVNRTRDLSASQVFVSLGVEEIPKYEFDVIVHAGSPASPKDHVVASNVFHANVNLTEQLVNSVRRGGVFIYFSSGEVYGRSSTKSLNEDSPLRPVLAGPRSYYPLAKLAGESISMSRSDIRSVVFRVFHTFGPGLREGDGRSFGDLLWGAKKHSRLELFSSGSQVRSFLDSRDLARAVELSAREKWVSGVFNVGSEQEISIRQFADLVASLTDSKITYSNSEASPVELSSIERLIPNIDKLKNIGWERTISLERTIIETVSSFRT